MTDLHVHPLLFLLAGIVLTALARYCKNDAAAVLETGKAAIWLGMAALIMRWCLAGAVD